MDNCDREITNLCVGVVCRFEPDVFDTHLREKDAHEACSHVSAFPAEATETKMQLTDKIC